SIFQAVGAEVALDGFWGGGESSEKGRGGVMAGGRLSTGAMFGEDGAGSVYRGKRLFEQHSNTSPEPQEAIRLFMDDLNQATIRRMVEGVDAERLTGEALEGLVAAIEQTTAGVTGFQQAMETLPFANLRGLTFDATAALIEFGGGLEALTGNINTYYQEFYS